MDLVSLMYRYINRFINSTVLLKELKNIDLSKYSKSECAEINKLILDVQNVQNKDLELSEQDNINVYKELFILMTHNSLVNKYAREINSEEMLKFITHYIAVPLPPKITQKEFDEMVLIAIRNDEREALWRLAFNYNQKDKDFSNIEDYFIEKRDGYYLTELLSAVPESLNKDKIIQKVMTTKDNDFINDFLKRSEKLEIISKEDIKKIQKIS